MASDLIPVIVMAFDRPRYLERVLQTVVAQEPLVHSRVAFHLFQDGHVSPRTGIAYGDAARIAESAAVFSRYLPGSTVHASDVNLGVAMNFDRAERFVFEDLKADYAIFLEDDLVLGHTYFRTMELLFDAVADRDEIGMITALGYKIGTSHDEQVARRHELLLMEEHNWAFGLKRSAWLLRDQVLAPYLEVVRNIDYRDRNSGDAKMRIKDFQLQLARFGRGYLSSQDSIKNLAFEALGIHRVTTFTNNARYIGREGEHSTAERFEQRGHDKTILYRGTHEKFSVPSHAELNRMRLELDHR